MKRISLKQILFAATLSLLIFSCNTTPKLVNPSDDARIVSVGIQTNDSSPNVSSAVFTVNHEDSIIFNVDSLPYGTRVDSLQLNFIFASSSGYIINDTVPESPSRNILTGVSNSGTTTQKIDLTNPIKVKNLSSDAKHAITYTIELRVHKVETYLHTWSQLNQEVNNSATENQNAILLNNTFYYFFDYLTANEVFTSTNATTWVSAGSMTGLPLNLNLKNMQTYKDSILLVGNNNDIYKSGDGKIWKQYIINSHPDYTIKSLLFSFKDRIWAAAQNKSEQKVRIASSYDGINWDFTEKREFSNFPVSDFSATRFRPVIGREKVLVTGGFDASGQRLNTLWSAENILGVDTLYWVNLQHRTFKMAPIANAGTAYYGNKMLMLGGTKSAIEVSDTLYQLAQSIDEGLTWLTPDTLINRLPENYTFRSHTSVIHDEKNYTLYLIGGQTPKKQLTDVWKVKVNFYSFKDFLEDPKKY